jgi:hypothetical protein
MNLREIEFEVVDCIHLAQERGKWWALVKRVTNLRMQKRWKVFECLWDY